MVGHVVSPFDLCGTLLVGGGLLVPCSLPGPPVVKQLMQMVTMVLARVGGFNQCASPNKSARIDPITHFFSILKKQYNILMKINFFCFNLSKIYP